MTLTQRIAWDDTILPFQLDRSGIRGRVARLDRTFERVLAQHAYRAPVEALLAEAAMLTAMIGQAIKLRWKLSLQLRGEGGPVRLLAADYFAPRAAGDAAQLRVWAGVAPDWQPETHVPSLDLLGQGYLGLTIDQGPGTTPYQGITPLAGDSLADCAAAYFAQSEQLPTRFVLAAARAQEPGRAQAWRAGGVMLQMMPASGSDPAAGGGSGAEGLLLPRDLVAGDEGEAWSRANLLLDTAEETELIGPHVDPQELLVRLFHEEGPRVFEPQHVMFGCTCSEDRLRRSLAAHPAEELSDMVTEAGVITADCQFCGAHYELDPATLGQGGTEDGDG